MNCKPGDLAIVIGGAVVENLGKIVTVVKLSKPGDRVDDTTTYVGSAPAWQVSGNLWTCDARGCGGHYTSTLHYLDEFLKPLPGSPITDDVEDEVTA